MADHLCPSGSNHQHQHRHLRKAIESPDRKFLEEHLQLLQHTHPYCSPSEETNAESNPTTSLLCHQPRHPLSRRFGKSGRDVECELLVHNRKIFKPRNCPSEPRTISRQQDRSLITVLSQSSSVGRWNFRSVEGYDLDDYKNSLRSRQLHHSTRTRSQGSQKEAQINALKKLQNLKFFFTRLRKKEQGIEGRKMRHHKVQEKTQKIEMKLELEIRAALEKAKKDIKKAQKRAEKRRQPEEKRLHKK